MRYRSTYAAGDTLQEVWISITGAAKTIGGMPRPAPGDVALLKGLIEAGKLRTVIDRRYSLDQIAEAHRQAAPGHKKGHGRQTALKQASRPTI